MLDSDGGGWTSGTDQSLLFQTMSATAPASARPRRRRPGLHQRRLGHLRLDEPRGTAVAAGRLRSRPGADVRQVRPGRDGAVVRCRRRRASSVAIDGSRPMPSRARSAAPSASPTSSTDERRRARGAAGGGGRDRGRRWTTRPPSCGCARTARTTCRSPSTASTISPARSTACRPGEAGYAAAAEARAYQLAGGGTAIDGPGYGNYDQTALLDVDAGDLIAMKLDQPQQRQHLLGLRPANERSRPVGRPSVELRAQHLGLGRHP